MKNLAVCLLCCSLSAQVAEKANEHYQTSEGRQGVAAGLSGASRDKVQKPQELIAALGIKPGMTVGDFGTGVGYMLPYFSKAVGPSGKVIAEDIFPDFLNTAKKNAASAGLQNVEFVLGTEKESHLPDGGLDLILALDVYHHLNYPAQVLADLKRKLKPGGRLVIVEYHKNEESMPGGRAMQHIRLAENDAIKEIETNGFRLLSRREFIPRVQWMGIFQPR